MSERVNKILPAALLAVIGFGISILIQVVHGRLAADVNYASFCNVNASVNCDVVLSSGYATLRGIAGVDVGDPLLLSNARHACRSCWRESCHNTRDTGDSGLRIGRVGFGVLGVYGGDRLLRPGHDLFDVYGPVPGEHRSVSGCLAPAQFIALHRTTTGCGACWAGPFGLYRGYCRRPSIGRDRELGSAGAWCNADGRRGDQTSESGFLQLVLRATACRDAARCRSQRARKRRCPSDHRRVLRLRVWALCDVSPEPG